MNICIVGHGPSLKGAGLGEKIDQFDKVIRLKNCYMLLAEPKDFGKRTDVMCSNTEVLYNLHKVEAGEYWGHPKKGTYNKAGVWQLERKTGKTVHVPEELCNLWNAAFRELGANHPNVSTGLAALIIGLDRFKPKTAYLAGFDKVLHPDTEGYQCTVPTPWNAGGTKDTGHDWAKERDLIPYLATAFQCEIKDLAGTFKAVPCLP